MKRTLTFAGVVAIAGVFCIVAAYFCQFYYHLHRDNVTRLEGLLHSFDSRLGRLEADKSPKLVPVHVWGMISTSDRPPDEGVRLYDRQETPADRHFRAFNAKGGPVIVPELRIPAGSTSNWHCEIQVDPHFGVVTSAWLSHAAVLQDLASFELLSVYSLSRSNIVRLNARLKPGASVQTRVELVLLCEGKGR